MTYNAYDFIKDAQIRLTLDALDRAPFDTLTFPEDLATAHAEYKALFEHACKLETKAEVRSWIAALVLAGKKVPDADWLALTTAEEKKHLHADLLLNLGSAVYAALAQSADEITRQIEEQIVQPIYDRVHMLAERTNEGDTVQSLVARNELDLARQLALLSEDLLKLAEADHARVVAHGYSPVASANVDETLKFWRDRSATAPTEPRANAAEEWVREIQRGNALTFPSRDAIAERRERETAEQAEAEAQDHKRVVRRYLTAGGLSSRIG